MTNGEKRITTLIPLKNSFNYWLPCQLCLLAGESREITSMLKSYWRAHPPEAALEARHEAGA